MKEIKQLLLQAGLAVLAAGVVSCGLGVVTANTGGPGAMTWLRDIGIIILALFSLVGSLIAFVAYFAGAWAISRFGAKAVFGANWGARKVSWVEDKVEGAVDRAAVRPVAKSARFLTQGKELVAASCRSGDQAVAFERERSEMVRGVSSLLRQLRRRTTMGEANQ